MDLAASHPPLVLPTEPEALRAALSEMVGGTDDQRALLGRLGTTLLGLCDSELFSWLDSAADARRQELKLGEVEAKRLHKEAAGSAKVREAEARRLSKIEENEEKKRVREEERLARLDEKKRKRGGEMSSRRGGAAGPMVSAARREQLVSAAAKKGLVVDGRVEGPLGGAAAYEGSWFEGTLLDVPEKGRAVVRFDLAPGGGGETACGDGATPVCGASDDEGRIATLPLDSLRPLPPPRPPSASFERKLRSGYGVPVELFFQGGWWEAEVLGGCGRGWPADTGTVDAKEALGVGSRVRANKPEHELHGQRGNIISAGTSGWYRVQFDEGGKLKNFRSVDLVGLNAAGEEIGPSAPAGGAAASSADSPARALATGGSLCRSSPEVVEGAPVSPSDLPLNERVLPKGDLAAFGSPNGWAAGGGGSGVGCSGVAVLDGARTCSPAPSDMANLETDSAKRQARQPYVYIYIYIYIYICIYIYI